MQVTKNDVNKSGIYCIRNMSNQKVYIGKAKNIYVRICQHISLLRKKDHNENRHLINAWHKYGENSFEYFVLEYLDLDEQLLAERELYWITQYDSINREKGYNLRLDSSTHMIVHAETKKLFSEKYTGVGNPNFGKFWTSDMKINMSNLKKAQYLHNEVNYNSQAVYKAIKVRNERWIKNPELKTAMKKKVSQKRTKYKFYQYTKDDNLVKIWDSVFDILQANPTYKRHNIYAVCSGEKPSMYGYKWIKVINDDIVQPSMKIEDK